MDTSSDPIAPVHLVRPKIFISWSGEKSKKAALYLRRWLGSVLQAVDPWMSDQDIGKGTNWNQELRNALNASQAGIVCLTRRNIHSVWLNFEAGYINRAISHGNRVIPLLLDVESAEIPGTFAQFQYATLEKDEIEKLLRSINECIGRPLVDPEVLKQAHDQAWGSFETAIHQIASGDDNIDGEDAQSLEPISNDSILREILDQVRDLARDRDAALPSSDQLAWGGKRGVPNFLQGDLIEHELYGQGEVVNVYSPNSFEPYQVLEVDFADTGIYQFHTQEIMGCLRFISHKKDRDYSGVPF